MPRSSRRMAGGEVQKVTYVFVHLFENEGDAHGICGMIAEPMPTAPNAMLVQCALCLGKFLGVKPQGN